MAEPRGLTQTGGVIGEDLVELRSNRVDPSPAETPVISFECPRKFAEIIMEGSRHHTKFRPRTVEEIEGPGQVFELDADLLPISGESEIDDQPYPTVRVVNLATGEEMDVEAVDYGSNEVTLVEEPTDAEDNPADVKAYPIITRGEVKWQAVDQFGQVEGPVNKWSVPIYDWADKPQNRDDARVYIPGHVRWGEAEAIELLVDSPQEIIWEDDDYPDRYVSQIEQRVDILL